MTVSGAGTGLYAKAKQRMLNKIGRKTSLTRNERVDYVSPRLEEIARTQKDVAALMGTFRTNYRKTLLAATHLGMHLVASWSNEVGARQYVPEMDVYVRDKSAAEMLIVQEASDDIRLVMENSERISTKFDEYLREQTLGAFGENDGQALGMLDKVHQAKERYKSARTKYSDAMIDFKAGTTTSQELDATRTEYEITTNELESNMVQYEDNWRHRLFRGTGEFFRIQLGHIHEVAHTLSDLEPWTSNLSINVDQMQTRALRHQEQRNLSLALREQARQRVHTPSATVPLDRKQQSRHQYSVGDTPPVSRLKRGTSSRGNTVTFSSADRPQSPLRHPPNFSPSMPPGICRPPPRPIPTMSAYATGDSTPSIASPASPQQSPLNPR